MTVDHEVEVETKLSVPEGFDLPAFTDVKGVDSVAVRTLHLRATYYDTQDLRLARGHVTLRHRTGEGRPRWTLKVEPATGPGREELSVLGPGTSVPPALLDLLTSRLRGAPLQPVAALRTRRLSRLLFDPQGNEVAEVVDDLVRVTGGASWRELEVELRAGGEKVAARVIACLTAAGAVVGDQTPKSVRAMGPAASGPPDLPLPGSVHRKDPAGALVTWSLRDGLQRLVQHDLGVRRGADDAVHQLRVTCRRLRSDLRTYRTLLDDPRTDALRAELAWLADRFGAARDLEVLRVRVGETGSLPPALDTTQVDALLAAREQVALNEALEALRSVRYLLLLQLLHDVAVAPGLSELAGTSCGRVLPDIVDRTSRHLARTTTRLGLDDDDAVWHRARILAKRARYAAESAQVALGARVRPTARHAKRLQTTLGEHQDAVVAGRTVLELATAHPGDTSLAVVCGRLAEREHHRLVAARHAFLTAR